MSDKIISRGHSSLSTPVNPGQNSKRLEDEASTGYFDSECLSSVCLGRSAPIVFQVEDREILRQLRYELVNLPIDRESAATDKTLVDIWNVAYPNEPIQEAVSDERWKRLGFQGKDPRTDLRVGRFQLDQLKYLADRCPEVFQNMVLESQDPSTEYLFAVSLFNLTTLIVVFFDLHANTIVGPSLEKPSRATQAELMKLVRAIQASSLDFFNDLFVQAAKLLHQCWINLRRNGTAKHMLDFRLAMQKISDSHKKFWIGATEAEQELNKFVLN